MIFGDMASMDPIVSALGWALTHFFWQGVVVGGVFLLGKHLIDPSRPNVRYVFGLCCMLALLAAPIVTAYLVYQEQVISQEQAAHQPLGGMQFGSVIPTSLGSESPVPDALALNRLSAVEAASQDISSIADRLMPLVVFGWALGVLFMSLRVGFDWYRMVRLVRVGVKPLAPRLQAKADELFELFGIRRVVSVLESSIVAVPTVLGWFKPVILLPTSSLSGLTIEQLELVIAHELGHIRRFDYLVNLFQVFVETLLFYHPVVRWISQDVRNEREKCCDDLVVTRCGNRLEYAKALSNLATIHRISSMRPALAATDGQLVERIERIVCQHAEPNQKGANGNLLVAMLFAVAIFAASRVAEPLSSIDTGRGAFGDRLVMEILFNRIPSQTNALLSPFEQAKAILNDPQPQAIIEQQTTSTEVVVETTAQTTQTEVKPIEQSEPATASIKKTSAGVETLVNPSIVNTEKVVLNKASTVEDAPSSVLPKPQDAVVNTVIVEAQRTRVAVNQLPLATLNVPILDVDQNVRSLETPFNLNTIPIADNDNLQVAAYTPEVPVAEASEKAVEVELIQEVALVRPHIVKKVAPRYPDRARGFDRSGYVTIEYSVASSGRPTSIKVIESHPKRLFDRSAKKAMRAWRFDPTSSLAFKGKRFSQRFDFSISEKGSAKTSLVSSNKSCPLVTGSRICKTKS